LAAIVSVTLPLPVPLAPVAMVIQVAVEVLVHEHAVPAVTSIVIVPPAAETVSLVGAIVNVQGAAACDTVTAWPAIVTVPMRAAPAFAAAVIVACPDALPPPATVSHGELLDVVHAHPSVAAT
jgi:hypothetical protein